MEEGVPVDITAYTDGSAVDRTAYTDGSGYKGRRRRGAESYRLCAESY